MKLFLALVFPSVFRCETRSIYVHAHTYEYTVHTQVPEGVTVSVEHRVVTVKGPRGELVRDFKHIRAEIEVVKDSEGATKVTCQLWHAKSKQRSALRTVLSHIDNMITGVTKGFRYKMRFVYAHFPVNANIPKEADRIEIRNFLGEKRVRHVPMQPGCKIIRDNTVKDQIIIEGNSIENVSRSCAEIRGSCLVRKKDIRKFLDGIYVSEKGVIETDM